MAEPRKLPNGSFVKGSLPMSCVMCQRGAKMVLLVTGKCDHGCWYCPLSLEKRGRDVTYADELLVGSDEDVIFEARAIGARGTGITGGDPLLVLDRTAHYIRLLKETFGRRHNIHLYTATPDAARVTVLAEAGLDEIRFHPPMDSWISPSGKYNEAIGAALDAGLRTGMEIPSVPGHLDHMLHLARAMYDAGAEFINLNELEISEGNCRAMLNKGFETKDNVSSSVFGSQETAVRFMERLDRPMTVHYCSSSFKDATQLRNRLMRRAGNTATDLEVITDEATFLKGVIETQDPERLVRALRRRFQIPKSLIRHDAEKARVEIAAWVLEDLPADIPGERFLVWEYPTADRLEVERQPL